MFKLEDKEYQFRRVAVQDALKLQNAYVVLSKENSSPAQIEDATNLMNDMCVKYLDVRVNGDFEEVGSYDYLESVFDNPFAIMEISVNFHETIKGFIDLLPKFQQADRGQKKKR